MNCGKGQSGERGCFQYLPETWRNASKTTIGYVAEQTKVNEHYVSVLRVQKLLEQNYSVSEIARIWNQGNTGPCKRGVNSHGVPYDSCAYVAAVLAYYNR